MDGHGQHENGRYRVDYCKGALPPWNMMPPHQVKEQNNALVMNKKIMSIINERDAAIVERNIALAEKKEALAAREEALQQRDRALAERDCALMERDKALAVLQFRENNFSMGSGMQRGAKRMHHPTFHSTDVAETLNTGEMQLTNALPMSMITSEAVKSCQAKQAKENKASLKKQKSPRNVKKASKDLDQHAGGDVKKFRSDWDGQNMGLKLVNFDDSTMPVPVCSCTGVPRQCYKWGSGGWQSSCCTTTLSSYPLPQMPNKRHVRVGGRKMSGSVFTKLISRLSFEGHDLSVPVDLKNFWAKHGTNRYITIK
ncbi:hypothetical protein SLA2020_054590 [Shorea laevis]